MMDRATFLRIWKRLAEQQYPVDEWVFTGGEPTLWDYLARAVETAKQYPFGKSKVRVVTNGLRAGIELYEQADTIQITDYGAINRIDQYRLKTAGGRRVKIQAAAHWDWDCRPASELPGECGCAGLSFAGDKVWGCAMAAAAQTKAFCKIEQSLDPLGSQSAHWQDFCRSCLVNRKNRKAPKPVAQLSVWEGRGVIIG